MKKEDIKVYTDPDDFQSLGNSAKFPCDTQFMKYNPLLHRYELTAQALEHNELILDGSEWGNVDHFLRLVSKKIYEFIQYKSGFKCYQVQMYRIAVAPETIYPSRYYMRKEFEKALIEQARYLINNGDSAQISKFHIENGKPNHDFSNPSEQWRDTSDIAPEAARTLETLGLLRWFKTSEFVRLNPDEY